MSTFIILVLFLTISQVGGGNSVSHNGVKGDQTVGGIHLFEIHSLSGGMGLGLKLLIMLAVALDIACWCLRQRTKKVARMTALSTAKGLSLPAVQYALQMAPMQMAAAGIAAGGNVTPRRVGHMDRI